MSNLTAGMKIYLKINDRMPGRRLALATLPTLTVVLIIFFFLFSVRVKSPFIASTNNTITLRKAARFSLLIGILTWPSKYDRRHFLRLVYGIQSSPIADIDVKFVLCNLTYVEQRVFVGLEILRFNDIIILNCTENMNSGKTYTYFSSLPRIVSRPYDYVMKADDDVFLRLAPLALSLQPLPRKLKRQREGKEFHIEGNLKNMGSDFHRLERFDGRDFVRWQRKMHFLLVTVKVYYVIVNSRPPEPGENEEESVAKTRERLRNSLKHCKEDINLDELGTHLRIEEDLRKEEKSKARVDAIFDESRFQSLPKQVEQKEGQRDVEENHENEVEPRRSKRMRIAKTYGPDFYMYFVEGTRTAIQNSIPIVLNVESDPRTYEEAMRS
ncbi:hypothetical protein RJ639_006136 [Escallonia herrerae]|uniref:Hexosyltransferase n=1 Tax=Escallonia herrerae TaxID=1293975 RepID=A0AA88W0V1_9ASTE|nr:hypothetical protein RJ639_006136 [Escallonia herrerae]